MIYKSSRKPTALRQWVLLNKMLGEAWYLVGHVVLLLYEQVAECIANIPDSES
jgi:hypothetical protein